MTQQAARDQTDVNAIVERFARDGYLPSSGKQPYYGDVTHLQGELTQKLQEAQDIIDRANAFAETWQEPPAETPPPTPPETPPETPVTATP